LILTVNYYHVNFWCNASTPVVSISSVLLKTYKFLYVKKDDIDALMIILNKYKNLKVLKYYNSNFVSANPTNATMHIYISYSKPNEKL